MVHEMIDGTYRQTNELVPIWNVLDLTPQGRGDWEASLECGTKVRVARG